MKKKHVLTISLLVIIFINILTLFKLLKRLIAKKFTTALVISNYSLLNIINNFSKKQKEDFT